jgi:hypothetical protein
MDRWARDAMLRGMSAYDAPRRSGGGRTALAVFLAVAVLAVLGSVFGYVLGTRANENKQASGGATPPGSNSPAASGSAGPLCPDFIATAIVAKNGTKPVTERLYLRTRTSEVWICADGSGALWYEGHDARKGVYPQTTPQEGVDSILLPGVNGINQDANGNTRYYVTNTDPAGKTTKYTISPDELDVTHPDGTNEQQKRVH